MSRTTVALALTLISLFVFSAAAPTVATAATTYYPLTLQGAGSTFVNPIMQVWATSFFLFTHNQVSVNYQAVGSGAGITDIEANTVNYAGSDAPVTAAAIAPYVATYGPFIQIPEALGGVAIFYNLPTVKIALNFTGPVLADIYLGYTTTWNASAITSLNPGCSYYGHTGVLASTCTIPSTTIIPVHRSDGSGTTYALSHFFNQTSTDWTSSVALFPSGCPCYSTTINWPSFEVGAKGSSGVASYVELNPNTIGYADSYYALSNSLNSAKIENQAGNFEAPTLATIGAAASADSAEVDANPTYTITNAPGATSYPISTYTYILMWADQTNLQQGYDLAQFVEWMVTSGQAYAPSLNYVKLPVAVVAIDAGLIQQLNYHGVPFFEATTTSVSCKTTSTIVGKSDACEAVVMGTTAPAPTGLVYFTSSSAGTFSSTFCTLAKHATYSSCTRSFTPTTVGGGIATIRAAYQGDGAHTASNGNANVTLLQATSKTYIFCSPATVNLGSTVTCKAKVNGYSPTGTVSWTIAAGPGAVTPSTATCTLPTTGATRECTVTPSFTGSALGHVTLQASYSGDVNNAASSQTKTITVNA